MIFNGNKAVRCKTKGKAQDHAIGEFESAPVPNVEKLCNGILVGFLALEATIMTSGTR